MLKKRRFMQHIIICLIVIIYTFMLNYSFQHNQYQDSETVMINRNDFHFLKPSQIYDVSGIYIDDTNPTANWSVYAAAGYPWFSGSGTKNDPYAIAEVHITSGEIYIRNSNAYFRVHNCEGPIILRNVVNGKLDNNVCSYIFDEGIIVENSNNNEITNNILNSNKAYGLYLINSHNNSIFGNTANDNGYNDAGIYISGNLNTIKQNTASFNHFSGIEIWGKNNTIKSNTVVENSVGITSNGYSTIIGNTAFNNSYAGIRSITIGYNNITGNFVDYNGLYGIEIYQSENDTIYNNTGYNNFNAGIKFDDGNVPIYGNNTAYDNAMYGCGYSFEGLTPFLASLNIDSSNLVNDKPFYYYAQKSDLIPSDFTNGGQVTLVDCSDSFISNLDVSNGTTGITLLSCVNTTFQNIDSSYNNLPGVYLHYSTNNFIIGCTINENGKGNFIRDGILIEESDNNTFSGNIINNNGKTGIYIESGDNNTIFDNTVNSNTDAGIYTYQCKGNLILENNVYGNADHGVYLLHSVNSTVKGNTVTHHQHVICDPNCHFTVDQYGILIESSQNCNITDNDTSDNEIGIVLKSSDHNVLFKNHPNADLSYGIWLYYSDFNLLLENLVEQVVYWSAIELDWSNNNTIRKNELRLGGEGVHVGFSSYNKILENDIDMTGYGVTFRDSDYNLVKNNTIRAGWACFEEDGDCIGNSFINNSCTEGFRYSGTISGFDLLLLLTIISVITICITIMRKIRKFKY